MSYKQVFGGREFVRITVVGSLGPIPQDRAAELVDIDHAVVTTIAAATGNGPAEEPDVVVVSVERYERSFAVGFLGRTEARCLNVIGLIAAYAGAAFLEDYNVTLHGGAYSLEAVAGE